MHGGILVPGNAPSALTIASAKTQGTVDPSDDLIANYSSRGPTWIDGFAKPDFAVPGQNLVAPAAPGSFLAVAYPSLLVKDTYGLPTYISLSGTEHGGRRGKRPGGRDSRSEAAPRCSR